MIEMIMMMMRRILNFAAPKTVPFYLSSSPSLKSRLFLSTPSSPRPRESSIGIVSGAAPAVADVSGGEKLLYPGISVSSPVKPLTMPTLLQPCVVLHDGVCHLCHWVKWGIEADKHRKIKFCCLQSKAAVPYLRACGLDQEDVLRRIMFIDGPGLYHQDIAALKVLSYLPLPYSALSALLIVLPPLRDAVYDCVAKHPFGQADDCLVLKEQELHEHFIDRDDMWDKTQSNL